MSSIEVKAYKVNSLVGLKPNSFAYLKVPNENKFEIWVTDKEGIPYPLKQNATGVATVSSSDLSIDVSGVSNVDIKVSTALQNLINSALQAGDNISELINNTGYITSADIPTKTSEFINDGADSTSTYVETDELGTTAFTNDYNDLDNLPTSFSNVVYVNSNDPNTATIFDLNNPPSVNDNSLKSNVNNLYIGLDSSTWTYNSTTLIYTTYVPSAGSGSNFFISGTSIDAGNNKTSAIKRNGTIETAGNKVTGGLSTQFQKADGSLDSTVYENSTNKKTVIAGNESSTTFFGVIKAWIDWFKDGLASQIPAKSSVLVDNDRMVVFDSEDSNKTKYKLFSQLKSNLQTYFDGIYLGISNNQTVSGVKTFLSGTIGFRNIANTFTSFITNSNTASRTYTLRDRNGILVDDTDLATKQNLFTGIVNMLPKSLNSTTLTPSRILDNGSFIGIDTVNPPLKDFTFGYMSNREIGIEQSNNVTIGKDLIISAGRTINYIDNALFQALTPNFGLPSYGMCSTPSGNIYIVTGTAMLYKQTGGSGTFASLGAVLPAGQQTRAICSTATNDLYIATNNGDIYKQTNETGAFVALGQTARSWNGMCRFGSDIYASVFGGDIYKQTGGTGNFIPLGQTVRNWGRMSSSSTAVYIAVSGSGIYKQVGGAGNFVLHSSQANSGGITVSNSNDIFVNSGTDMYKQTNETGSFVATGSTVTNNGIWGMATHANGNIYAGDFSATVFMLLNNGAGYANLNGGILKLKSGTAKGTGVNRVEIYTGQKTTSGTDMQVETLRAYYDENGYYINAGIPTYANDAAADADSNLPSKAFYKITGNRGVFQKP